MTSDFSKNHRNYSNSARCPADPGNRASSEGDRVQNLPDPVIRLGGHICASSSPQNTRFGPPDLVAQIQPGSWGQCLPVSPVQPSDAIEILEMPAWGVPCEPKQVCHQKLVGKMPSTTGETNLLERELERALFTATGVAPRAEITIRNSYKKCRAVHALRNEFGPNENSLSSLSEHIVL